MFQYADEHIPRTLPSNLPLPRCTGPVHDIHLQLEQRNSSTTRGSHCMVYYQLRNAVHVQEAYSLES
jgi:hypothetical protein